MIPKDHRERGDGEKFMFTLYPHSIPRCQHIKVNGTQCGSPALRRNRLCYFHKTWQGSRIALGANRARRASAVFDLPLLEDANSIQLALMQVMRLILSGQLDGKTAGLLLYALQTASSNLARTNFEPTIKTRVVIDPRTVDQTPLGEDPWNRDDYREQEENEEDQQENAEVIAGAPDADKKSTEEEVPQIQAVAARRNLRPMVRSKRPCAKIPALGWTVASTLAKTAHATLDFG
jgi:hypothetical protein